VFTKLGLEPFGKLGDPFDPAIHEAVLHDESDAVTEPTCTTVMRQGYLHRDRLLRPAMVGVTDPIAPPGLGEHPLQPNPKHAATEPQAEDDEPQPLEGDETAEAENNETTATPPENEVQGDPGDKSE
jgi:molecular chaperone GrpE